MTPAVDRPRPRLAPRGPRKKDYYARGPAKPPKHEGKSIAAVAGLCALGLGLLAFAGWRTKLPDFRRSPAAASAKPAAADPEREAAWFNAAEGTLVGDGVTKALNSNPQLQPGSMEVKTRLITFRRRTLEAPPPAAGGSDKVPEAAGVSGMVVGSPGKISLEPEEARPGPE